MPEFWGDIEARYVLLGFSVLALLVGPLLDRLANRARPAMSFLDGFVFVAIGVLILLDILPHTVEVAGVSALFMALIGLALPFLLERIESPLSGRLNALVIILAVVGLIIHGSLDGLALSAGANGGDADTGRSLALAVVLHRLPVGLLVWWIIRPAYGTKGAVTALILIVVSTVLGFSLGHTYLAELQGEGLALFESLVAGALLHVLLHRPEDRPAGDPEAAWRPWEALGGAVGLGVLVFMEHAHEGAHPVEAVSPGAADSFVAIAMSAAPALLLAYVVASVLIALLPRVTLSWIRGGSPVTGSVRGAAMGLTQPTCSCDVEPVYRNMLSHRIPVSSAAAFWVAAIQIGIVSVFFTVPLLGLELLAVRLVAAKLIALAAGWWIGRSWLDPAALEPEQPHPHDHHDDHAERDREPTRWGQRLSAGFKNGFGEVIDDTAPWILAGLVVVAAVSTDVAGVWLADVPNVLMVLAMALLGSLVYVAASGATALAAAAILLGISPGAAMAFMVTAPGISLELFSTLRRFHGRSGAIRIFALLFLLAVGVGLAADWLLPDTVDLDWGESTGILNQVSLVLLALAFGVSALRQGPRGFVHTMFPTRHHLHEHHHHDHHNDRHHDHHHDHHHSSHEHD